MSLNQIIDQDVNGPLVCDDTLNLCGNQLRLKSQLIVPNGEFTNVDTVTINNVPYPPGGGFLPAPVPNKILRTNNLSVVSWGDVNPSNLTGGSTGDVLKTIAPGTVAWAPVTASNITPGTSNQILHTNLAGTAAEWTSNLEVPGTFKVDSSSILDGNVDCNQVLNVDGNFFSNANSTLYGVTDIEGDLHFVSNAGTVGQVLTKTGASTQNWQTLSVPSTSITPGADNQALMTRVGTSLWSNILSSDITPGLANQLLVTNGTGTASTWTFNPTIPGILNLLGNLQFNSISGTTGQFIKKTGPTSQAFANIIASDIAPGSANTVLTTVGGVAAWSLPSTINVIKYGTTLANQNLNSAAGPTALTFSTSPYINSAISTVGSPTAISQPSTTEFTIGTLGTYNVDITGYIDPTSTGLGNSIVALSLEINGVEQSTSAIVCNGNYSFSGRFAGVLFSAGATIRILARRIAGTNTLNTFASGTGVPSFSSTIYFST